MTPVLAPAVSGLDVSSGEAVGAGTSPVLSWAAPAVGAVDRYTVTVYRLYARPDGLTGSFVLGAVHTRNPGHRRRRRARAAGGGGAPAGRTCEETANELLRSALRVRPQPQPPRPFTVEPRDLGLRAGLSYDRACDLLDTLEGPRRT